MVNASTTAAGPDNSSASHESDNAEALSRLGALVRTHRRQLGLTLREVADRTGLSSPFLSQVENGNGAPSLTSLFTLARVLGTTPEALLAGPAMADVSLVRHGEGTPYPISDTNGLAVRLQLTGTAEPFSAAEYVVEPGADLGGFQASDGRDLLHVLSGQVAVEIRRHGETVEHVLAAGDTLVYHTSDEHRWRIIGDQTARFLQIVSTLRLT